MSPRGARVSAQTGLPSGARYADELDEAQIAAAVQQVHAIWGGDYTPGAYLEHVHEQIGRSDGALSYAGVIDDSGKLIASYKRYDVVLASPDGPVHALGIGAVFTPEAKRGQGLAAGMLAAAMQRSRERGQRMALLFSEIEPSYYERLGFRRLPAKTYSANVAILPREPEVEVSACDDFATLLGLHERSQSVDGWWMKRTESSFRYWAWRHGTRARFLISRGGETLGYLSVAIRAQALWVEDAARVNAPREVLWVALRRLAERAGRSEVAGWLRPDDAAGAFDECDRKLCIPMLRPLDDGDDNPALALANADVYFSALDSF
jgi:predicted N-acetyltransferase YhbS